jgi:hypothetical protein
MQSINWNGIIGSLLRTLLGFALIYIPYYAAKVLTESSRKNNSKSLALQYFQSYAGSVGVVCGIAAIVWVLLSNDSVDEDTGEVTAALPSYRARDMAIKLMATILLPVLFGVFRGFRTSVAEIEKIPEPNPLNDNEGW